MVQEGFLLDIIPYSAAIDGLIKTQEVDRALELFPDICSRGYCPDVAAYNILISVLYKAKRVSEDEDILHEMEAMLFLSQNFVEDRKPNVTTYTTLMNGLCNAGRPDDALEMAGKGNFPDPLDKNCLIVRDAVPKLSEDARTSSRVRNLIAEGRIPKICCSDIKDEG
nr:putative pentatricopeptide repeat-containing protein, mitochondrial [Quercus suber]